ncbi:MAG: hypothetical protein ACWA6V_20510, partial [Cellvibrio sp.]
MFRAAFTFRLRAPVFTRLAGPGILLSLFISPVFLAASVLADDKPAATETGLLPLEELRTFTRVYDHVRNGYVDEIDDAKLLEYAIKGMISEH